MILIIVGLALVVSVVLNLLLGFYARQFYLTLAHLRLDPLQVHYYPDENPMTTKNPHIRRVVFFGDSRAESWPALDGLEGHQFINRGIGGQTSAQVLGRFDEHIRPLQPDIIVIQVGINDLSTIALFPARRDEIVTRCKENLVSLVKKSLEINAAVVLTTIFPHGPIAWDRTIFWSDAVDEATGEVNALIVSLASQRVRVFDTRPALQDEHGLVRGAYQDDFLHLNGAGYHALNAELGPLLLEIEK
jgi:lysophospholipase L1-like esterase